MFTEDTTCQTMGAQRCGDTLAVTAGAVGSQLRPCSDGRDRGVPLHKELGAAGAHLCTRGRWWGSRKLHSCGWDVVFYVPFCKTCLPVPTVSTTLPIFDLSQLSRIILSVDRGPQARGFDVAEPLPLLLSTCVSAKDVFF